MSGPLVTVLMPTRNAAETIEDAVESIQAQTLSAWELTAVDDGSTDGTIEILRSAAARDPRIRVFSNPGRGIVAALNFGLRQARGRLIARMDADDQALPERLARQAAWLKSRPGTGAVGCRVRYGGDARRARGLALYVAWSNRLTAAEDILRERFVESPLVHPSVMFRRELIESCGAYAAGDFPEDYELWLRWMAAGVRIEKVPEALLVWNDRQERLSRSDARYRSEAFFRLKARYLAPIARKAAAGGREIWIWGAGRLARRRAAMLEAEGVPIAGYVDVDPRKIGHRIRGRPVVGPEELPEPSRALAISYVAKRGARQDIRNLLMAKGFCEARDFWMAA